MNDFIKNTLLKPLFERLGTLGAGLLVFGGDALCARASICGLVTPDGAQQVAVWVVAAALVVVDLVPTWLRWARARR